MAIQIHLWRYERGQPPWINWEKTDKLASFHIAAYQQSDGQLERSGWQVVADRVTIPHPFVFVFSPSCALCSLPSRWLRTSSLDLPRPQGTAGARWRFFLFFSQLHQCLVYMWACLHLPRRLTAGAYAEPRDSLKLLPRERHVRTCTHDKDTWGRVHTHTQLHLCKKFNRKNIEKIQKLLTLTLTISQSKPWTKWTFYLAGGQHALSLLAVFIDFCQDYYKGYNSFEFFIRVYFYLVFTFFPL